MFILIGEVYNHYNKDIFGYNIDTFSTTYSTCNEITLVKSNECESCHSFINSGVWDIFSKLFMHTMSFIVYDTSVNKNEIQTLLGDLLSKFTHVPCIFIKSASSVYKYEDCSVYVPKHVLCFFADGASCTGVVVINLYF